jgi:uncharacterized protein YceK
MQTPVTASRNLLADPAIVTAVVGVLTGQHGQRVIATLIALLTLSGCVTIGTLAESETKNKIFSGTIRHIDLKCAHAVCLDMPFSLVADAVIIPVTIPWTAYNFIKSDENQEPSENGGREK